jgi:hypothetical protein
MSNCDFDRRDGTLPSINSFSTKEGNMRIRSTVKILGALAAVALVAVPAASAATNVHKATLTGSQAFPAVNGKAKFSVDNGVNQLEAEIQDADALAGSKVRFIVDGQKVGADKVNALGNARIDVSGASVPNVSTGSKIKVVQAGTGTLVARGTFN